MTKNNKLLLVIVSGIVLAALIVGVLLFLQQRNATVGPSDNSSVHKDQPVVTPQPAPPATPEPAKASIGGLSDESLHFKISTQDLIIRDIYAMTTRKHGSGTYTPAVRQGSLQLTNGNRSFIIDIPETKEAYLLETVFGGEAYYIRCAPENLQLTQPSVCRDEAQ